MKKVALIFILVLLVGVVLVYILQTSLRGTLEEGIADTPVGDETVSEQYKDAVSGLTFSYRAGSDAYILLEQDSNDITAETHVKTVTLMRLNEYEEVLASTEPREGPPAIQLHVFENPNQLSPNAWAEEYLAYSNFNLIIGDSEETTVSGAEAITYRADGLYVSENYVVVHGDNAYVLTGQFLDESSDIRQDFAELVSSITFTTSSVQQE